jgi:hypothetical protein
VLSDHADYSDRTITIALLDGVDIAEPDVVRVGNCPRTVSARDLRIPCGKRRRNASAAPGMGSIVDYVRYDYRTLAWAEVK